MSMCSFVAHLCARPVCLQLRHGSQHSQPLFTPLAFQPSQKQPLKPTSLPFHSLSHLIFVLFYITSNTGTKAAEQKPWLKNRPITNINLKRCWSAESTFMYKDNSGSLFFSSSSPTPAGGFFMSCNEVHSRLQKERQKGCNYPLAKALDSAGQKDSTLAIMQVRALRQLWFSPSY